MSAMTKDQARIVILEEALNGAHHTISFMHGCLTDPEHYSYEYPGQTVRKLRLIETLITIHGGCFHSRYREDCNACCEAYARRQVVEQAKSIIRTDV